MKNFYKKFRLITTLPFWSSYLRTVYRQTVQDSLDLGIISITKRKNPTILLCGVSGEITANEFITFILKNNRDSNIIVIDLGQEQIDSVKRLVKEKFSNANIYIKRANALNLGFITDKSIDWIDTDGFFSFFDDKQLQELFKEWKRILRDDGFITFRELISRGFISTIANKLRAYIAKTYMGIELHLHSKEKLEHCIKQVGFTSRRGISPIPLLDRYIMMRQE